VNVGQDTTLSDRDVSQKLVQFLIVTDGELEMTGNDTGLLVVTGSVTSQLEDFGREVFENGSEVDGSTGTNTLSVVTLSEETVDTSNWECETGFRRTRLRVLAATSLSSRFTSSHFERVVWLRKRVKKLL